MLPVAIFLLVWAAFCLTAAWRAAGPRLLMLPMILLLPTALTPAYFALVDPDFGIAPGQCFGSVLLMGTLALAVRRRSGRWLSVIGAVLTLSMLTLLHRIREEATLVPFIGFAFAARVIAILVIFYIVKYRQDTLRLPDSRERDDRSERG